MSVPALVLRTTPYRDNDLIVDLLTEPRGRVAVMARSARKSRRRYGGALEPGTRISAQISDRGRGMPTLSGCDITGALVAVRTDLDRFHHLAYTLELARLLSVEGEADPRGFALVTGYLEVLEVHGASHEALAAWELRMLEHHGYGLRLDACTLTGRPPDGLSLKAGGAVNRAAAPPDAYAVPPNVLATLAELGRGRAGRIEPADRAPLRRLFADLWGEIAGRELKSARFLTL